MQQPREDAFAFTSAAGCGAGDAARRGWLRGIMQVLAPSVNYADSTSLSSNHSVVSLGAAPAA
jgi:hypothetical protein